MLMSSAYFSTYLDIWKKTQITFYASGPRASGRYVEECDGAHSNSPYLSKYFEISVFHQKLNSVSSQCARGKSDISRKQEDRPKNFKW